MKFTLTSQLVKDRACEFVQNCGDEPVMELVLKPHKSNRSLAQNNLIHAWMRFVSVSVGESHGKFFPPEHWKLYFKKMFLGEETVTINGEEITRIPSTAKLSVKEKARLLTNIDNYCGSEMGIYLPRPGDGESF